MRLRSGARLLCASALMQAEASRCTRRAFAGGSEEEAASQSTRGRPRRETRKLDLGTLFLFFSFFCRVRFSGIARSRSHK